MDNLNKSWLVDYPPEIRLLVYDHFFSLMNVGIHAIEGHKRRDSSNASSIATCPLLVVHQQQQQQQQLSSTPTSNDNDTEPMPLLQQQGRRYQQKALSLLLTCKAINAEATPFFYSSCTFETVDCHCWYNHRARLPAFARQRIRNVVCPVLGGPGCISTLEKVFQQSGPKCLKRLTLVPVFFAEGPEGSNQSGKRMLDHLLSVLFSTRYELKELSCWLVDRDRRLCHISVDAKHNARVSVPYPVGVDTDLLLQELQTKCRVLKKIVFIHDDRVRIVHDFMMVSKRHDSWLQMREFQNVQR